MSLKTVFVLASLLLAAQTSAQSTAGTMVIVPAFGEVTHPNDEAVIARTRTAVEELCRRFPVYGG